MINLRCFNSLFTRRELGFSWPNDKVNKCAIYWYPMKITGKKPLIRTWHYIAVVQSLTIEADFLPFCHLMKNNNQYIVFVPLFETANSFPLSRLPNSNYESRD